jgi:hypothetical protein
MAMASHALYTKRWLLISKSHEQPPDCDPKAQEGRQDHPQGLAGRGMVFIGDIPLAMWTPR